MEYVKIEFTIEKWEAIRNHLQLTANTDYTVKEVKIKDDFFKDDEYRNDWKKRLDKEYRLLLQYEHKKRNP
jgi:hypothetical protein